MTEKVKFKINQGTTFRYDIQFVDETNTPVDITNTTAKLQIRKTVDDPVVLLELTTENGGILKYSPLEGIFRIYISDEQTSAINWLSGTYDMKIFMANGDSYRIIEGSVSISKQVTR